MMTFFNRNIVPALNELEQSLGVTKVSVKDESVTYLVPVSLPDRVSGGWFKRYPNGYQSVSKPTFPLDLSEKPF